MNNPPVVTNTDAVLQTLVTGDISKLTTEEKLSYYCRVCESLGLNPLTKPFAYMKLSGKETLYATRDCADQLRRIHSVSIRITAREQIGDVYVVTASATLPSGRTDESTGAVPTKGLNGDALANAYLKCETKAKRRVTLSVCGLGLLDETEVEAIKDAVKFEPTQTLRLKVKTLDDVSEEESRHLLKATSPDRAGFVAPAKPVSAVPASPFSVPAGVPSEYKPGEYVAHCGRAGGPILGHKIKDIDPNDLLGFMQWLRRGGKDGASQEYLSQTLVQEFIVNAEDYINEQKRKQLEPGE